METQTQVVPMPELVAPMPELVEGRGTEQYDYTDVLGFPFDRLRERLRERVRELGYVLTPGRYVGIPEEEDDFDFAERFATLQAEFTTQLEEENRLNTLIQKNLRDIHV